MNKAALVLLALLTAPLPLFAATVVVDPGHGGNRPGADLGDGREKEFVLEAARRLAGLLQGRHQVVLTREEDYFMGPADRAGLANNLKADLFLSIHAAPRGLPGPARAFVWRWDAASTRRPAAEHAAAPTPWQALQAAHAAESARLAQVAALELGRAFPDTPVHAGGLPLTVLEGADMPALLVEIPQPVPGGQDREAVLSAAAAALARAVERFLAETPVTAGP
ncbi:MAG: N-acetylmuramoyl-L-alanine amidase [Deltaproteobacteria bacterium]|nr:N-acetylmuramoyl-L-alanine amidase [Deltaproteobacteria bacterium]